VLGAAVVEAEVEAEEEAEEAVAEVEVEVEAGAVGVSAVSGVPHQYLTVCSVL
jgi:hypothetical protein